MKSDRMYIVKGRVTDPEAHKEPCRVGDIEWRLMDDPLLPSYSYDYLTLEDLIYDNAGLPMVFYDDAMLNQEQDRLDTAVKLREMHG
jgi:hypothetical protein